MILSVANLNFAYNSHPVLDAVTFSVEKGQLLAILGVNGAGKSTLLKCLNRILRPQAGAIFLAGEDLLGLSQNAIARRVGYVPQQHEQQRLTVYEVVLLGRRPHMGLSAGKTDYAVVEAVLARMGLSAMALRHVDDLSGGEVQKVMIARALAQSPQILLLDEPTSNLDLKNQMEVMRLVRNVVDVEGLTAVMAIHDLNLALRFADHFLLVKDHRIHRLAARDELDAETIEQVYGLPVTMQTVAGQRVVVPV
ncbi:ABC transporter ATP-binding protein [Desulfosarcina ovata]|uniref:ABC transporter ATP-binding protein n=2 Tax=Desulfosarcina ovata TaxID=83564 RepID=A0A5K8AA75_9BACT|nr:ABC transporter ATP-binding protein [Desulfosarcina ovata]BBO82282.1 ABC transporter ATP-binding protein [Desulfosarcina ovata subsp. sediminis]BBO89495.1 ABC transporter ATP-binding protein [Desulfosarcina ovata subsp. ovata]